MEESYLRLRGDGLEEAPQALAKHLLRASTRSDRDLDLVLHERYSFRTNSSLLTVVAFHPLRGDERELYVVTGGGGSGLLDLDFGACRRQEKIVRTALEKACQEKGWILDDAP